MKYYALKSIFTSDKRQFALRTPSDSFRIIERRQTTYIEPSFEKVIFEQERPAVMFISAVGASGKSALAATLSHDTGLPLLDLAKHKPVGDNTLTGLLTVAYPVEEISGILKGLATGSYGIIIDGIDEAYSKTTAKAFEAFLDDIAVRCKTAKNCTFVILGRSKAAEECWSYLIGAGVSVGLVTISPFSLENARAYIDGYTDAADSPHLLQYQQVRDQILAKLQAAFDPEAPAREHEFLTFIGYPPVLDAIATLLRTERNFGALQSTLREGNTDVETDLLYQIADYILLREREKKVLPNIVQPITDTAPPPVRRQAISDAFLPREQCLRLLAHCLGETLSIPVIEDSTLNGLYERQIANFLPEHPFLSDRTLRNAVFEAVAIATVLDSPDPRHLDLLDRYSRTRKHTYYLIYTAQKLVLNKAIPPENLRLLIGAAMEFRSAHTAVDLAIEAPEPASSDLVQLDIAISVDKDDAVKEFSFESTFDRTKTLSLGSQLEAAYVSVPGAVLLSCGDEVELTSPILVEADEIVIRSRSLVLRSARQSPKGDANAEDVSEISILARRVDSSLEQLENNGVDFLLSVDEPKSIGYPLAKYATVRQALPEDPQLAQKYFRLKRILMEFRSHSKGALAKYKHKIEHERVLKNELGRSVLNRLVVDGILYLKGSFYYVNPEAQSRFLGTTWQDLRQGRPSDTLLAYLRSI